jgi:hypothetical protein
MRVSLHRSHRKVLEPLPGRRPVVARNLPFEGRRHARTWRIDFLTVRGSTPGPERNISRLTLAITLSLGGAGLFEPRAPRGSGQTLGRARDSMRGSNKGVALRSVTHRPGRQIIGRRPPIVAELVDQRASEDVEPAPRKGLQFARGCEGVDQRHPSRDRWNRPSRYPSDPFFGRLSMRVAQPRRRPPRRRIKAAGEEAFGSRSFDLRAASARLCPVSSGEMHM